MTTRPLEEREGRTPLSTELVLRMAMNLADERGIESLTMRQLARELGVEAMSLYHHVQGKDDILDGIVDLVVGEIALPAIGVGWKTALRDSSVSAYLVLSRHPWACGLMLASPRIRPTRLRYMDSILATLRGAGFSTEMTHRAYHALDSHVVGFTLWEVNFSTYGEDLADLGARFLESLPADEYPFLAEHVEHHLSGPREESDGEFEFGLDLILDGLERMKDTA